MPKRDRTSESSGLVSLQISVRTAIILLLALAAGLITTVLLWTTAVPMVQAILSGIASSAGTFQFLDKITDAGQ